MQKKYGVLRVVATIFKILAWIVLVVGLLGACVSIAASAVPGLLGAGARNNPLGIGSEGLIVGLATGLGVIFLAVLYFLFLYAFGELIYLLIALEENTRLTAERLHQLPVAAPPVPAKILPPPAT
jgi:hypothetical protein